MSTGETMTEPSTQFLRLVSSLLSNLSPSSPVPDVILLQLHAVFGPMLTSALQLVDRRDVVKVCLPGGRVIHQVTSSAGAPYTLYLDLPALPSPPPPPTIVGPDGPPVDADTDKPEVSSDSDAQNTRIGDDVRCLKALYCPCAGFAFNSLTGGRNVFCKHLLAAVLAHRLGKVLETHVGLAAVAVALGGGGADQSREDL